MKACQQRVFAEKICGKPIEHDTYNGHPSTNFCSQCFRKQMLHLAISEATEELTAIYVSEGAKPIDLMLIRNSIIGSVTRNSNPLSGKKPGSHVLEWVMPKELVS